MEYNKDIQSKIIAYLRFPLILGVFFIHTRFESVYVDGVNMASYEASPIYYDMAYLISEIFGRIVIPLLFAISGFLFFRNCKNFDRQFYGSKLKRRIKSLFVPYVFWNFVVYLITLSYYVFGFGDEYGDSVVRADEFSVKQFLLSFWNYDYVINPEYVNPEQGPIAMQFWFVRDLMMVVLCTPLIYFLVKRFKFYIVGLLGLLWLANIKSPVSGLNVVSLFFFMLGAYCSLYQVKFENVCKRMFYVTAPLYFISAFVELFVKFEPWAIYLHNVNILVGILFVVGAVAKLFELRPNHKVNQFLSESSFFMFAYHGVFLYNFAAFCNNLLKPTEDWQLMVLYFVYFAISVLLGLVLFKGLKRYFPKFTSVITGGR